MLFFSFVMGIFVIFFNGVFFEFNGIDSGFFINLIIVFFVDLGED